MFLSMSIRKHHILGMIAMILCIVAVSLSDLNGDEEEVSEVVREPVWKAVCMSMIPPCIIAGFSMYIKYVKNSVRLRSYDFTIAYWGLLSFILQLTGLIYFMSN